MRLNLRDIRVNHSSVLFLFLILSFLFDFINKIYIFFDIDFIKFNRILKLIFSIYSMGFFILHYKLIYKRIRFIIIVLLVLLLIFLIKGDYYNLYKMEFLRYNFIFLSFPLLFFVVSDKKVNITTIFYKILKYLICLNAILILLLFQILSFFSI